MANEKLCRAREYAEKLGEEKTGPFELFKALKVLADAGDKDSFKKIVDYCSEHPEIVGINKKEILNHLEWACMSVDHSFTAIGERALRIKNRLPVEPLEIGSAQKMFRENYGVHYDLSDPSEVN